MGRVCGATARSGTRRTFYTIFIGKYISLACAFPFLRGCTKGAIPSQHGHPKRAVPRGHPAAFPGSGATPTGHPSQHGHPKRAIPSGLPCSFSGVVPQGAIPSLSRLSCSFSGVIPRGRPKPQLKGPSHHSTHGTGSRNSPEGTLYLSSRASWRRYSQKQLSLLSFSLRRSNAAPSLTRMVLGTLQFPVSSAHESKPGFKLAHPLSAPELPCLHSIGPQDMARLCPCFLWRLPFRDLLPERPASFSRTPDVPVALRALGSA